MKKEDVDRTSKKNLDEKKTNSDGEFSFSFQNTWLKGL